MSDEPFLPSVVILPETQAEIDAEIAKHPELGKVIASFKEAALNAMQGVRDKRYANFEDAMEAITGQRPEKMPPPNPPRFGYFCVIARVPNGDGYMAVITDGCPKVPGHDPIEVMDMDCFKTEAEAEAWAQKTVDELPWRTYDEDGDAD